MDIVTKDFPVTTLDATDEYPNGGFEVILSAPTLDRDGEIIDSRAFEPLPTHITFDTDHSMTCDSVVGSGTPYYAEDGTLRVKGGYASDARSQTIRTKVLEGHIRTTSVTFMAAQREEDDKGIVHVVKGELLNGTFTPVPSNRESVVLTAKSIVAKATRKDLENIQVAHDALAAIGAACELKSATDTEGKNSPTGDPEAAPEADAPEPVDVPESTPATTEATGSPAADDAAAADDEDDEKRARISVIENAARFAFGS